MASGTGFAVVSVPVPVPVPVPADQPRRRDPVPSSKQPNTLVVKGESFQQLYTLYVSQRFIVNRRYQRKLVWTVEEKQKLIDSIVKGLPIPLILLADSRRDQRLEMIDGLQRLDAVFSFMENQYAYEGYFFDLDTLADTKYLRDKKTLRQRKPVLDRVDCASIANYQLPVSTYTAESTSSVDEVFRRINSSGRHLSLQEMRQAGAVSPLATLVRKISTSVRGDTSISESVQLSEMKKISITSRDLNYGIAVEDIFWIREGILEPDSVRESGDEEFVLDLVLDLVLEPLASSGSRYRDSAYGLQQRTTTESKTVESRVAILGPASIEQLFLDTLAVFTQVRDTIDVPIAEWVVTKTRYRGIRRHFHAMFIGVAQLLRDGRRHLANADRFAGTLEGFWDGDLTIPSGGGDWGAGRKKQLIDMVKTRFREHFPERTDPATNRVVDAAIQFEATLNMAITESSLFELKLGFCNLNDPGTFSETNFQKMLKTAAAMANQGPNTKGIILVGVADDSTDSAAAERMAGIEASRHKNFFIVGTQHELDGMGKNVDEMWRFLNEKIVSSKLDRNFAKVLARKLQPFRYKGHLVWMIEVNSQSSPVTYDDSFFDRRGPSTIPLTGTDVVSLVRRFDP